MAEIRLLLVEDHDVVRTGLRMLLETHSDLVIVGEAGTAAELFARVTGLRPDIVLMDISLPDMSGIDATRRLKEICPGAAVIALTIHEDEQYFFSMLQAGASGYVPKRAAPEDLISAIRSVHAGDVYIHPSLARLMVSDFLGRAGEPGREVNGLTPREQEVLTFLAEGRTNDEIAAALVISPHTVARHRENLMRKLGLHSRSDLVKYAVRKGLIRP